MKMSHEELGTLGTITKQTVERVNPNMSCYRWKINGFSQFSRGVSACIISSGFTAIDSKVIWRLKLYPNSRITTESNFMQLGIYYYSLIGVKASLDLSIVNVDNEVLQPYTLKKEVTLQPNPLRAICVRSGDYIRFGKRCEIEDPNSRILANDSLTISFNVTFHDSMVKLPTLSKHEIDNLKNERLKEFDEFGKLLDNDKFSDVEVIVGDKKIHVHKAILANRSPVFEAMFTNEMQEKKQNRVEIIDIEYAVLMELFRFMYTGVVRDIENMASDLLVAAEKYCVDRLKMLCEKTLLNGLKVDNALKRLSVADKCNASDLKKKALEYVVKHGNRVTEKEEFDELRPDLVREITRAMARKLNIQ